jgi:hypothetical protein
MKILALLAVIASLALAATAIADTTTENSKTATTKVQTTTPAAAPAAKMDMSKGCTMPMDHAKSGGCCGM